MYIRGWDDSKYVRVGNLMLPLDTSEYGNQTGEEISRRTTSAYEAEKREEEARRAAEEQRRREIEKGKRNYQLAFENVDESQSVEDKMTAVFDALVPDSGPCDNIAGELVRAIMRIRYRDWNDGDLFYEGYGLETCGSSAAYLVDFGPDSVADIIYNIASNGLEEAEYTAKLEEIESKIYDYIKESPELFGKDTPDSRDDYVSDSIDYIKDCALKYEFEPDVYSLQYYVDNDCISDSDIYDWLCGLSGENWGGGFGGEVDHWASDAFTVKDLDREQLRAWEENYSHELEAYLNNLQEQFPDEDEEEEDYNEDEYNEDEM